MEKVGLFSCKEICFHRGYKVHKVVAIIILYYYIFYYEKANQNNIFMIRFDSKKACTDYHCFVSMDIFS